MSFAPKTRIEDVNYEVLNVPVHWRVVVVWIRESRRLKLLDRQMENIPFPVRKQVFVVYSVSNIFSMTLVEFSCLEREYAFAMPLLSFMVTHPMP